MKNHASLSRVLLLSIALGVTVSTSSSPLVVDARQARSATDGVYTEMQATRGQQIYGERCAACHGPALQGQLAPPLSGASFISVWGSRSLSDLVNKIQNTMPANSPGTLTREQATDLVAYILQAAKFPVGRAELTGDDAVLKQIMVSPGAAPAAAIATGASRAPTYPPVANLGQLMRGILFPSSNLIFNVQTHDPGEVKTGAKYEPSATAGFSWVDWGAGIYSGWELVDYAAVSIADSAPLLLAPGRRCENGRPVPVERADWITFTTELVEAGQAAYRASQTRNQELVSDVSNQLADACLHCHEVYRDKPGGTTADPSNKAARCF
jgi:mono/diheme cytochrome c family protein